MDISEDYVQITLKSTIHLCKSIQRARFRTSQTIQDVMNYFLSSNSKLCDKRAPLILLNDQRVPLRPESTLLNTLGDKRIKSAQFILSIDSKIKSKRLDLILIVGISYFLAMMALTIGLVMYLSSGWSSDDGKLSIFNAYSNGTELGVYNSFKKDPSFRCFINSNYGVSSLVNSLNDSEFTAYLTNSHCFNKTTSSLVFLGATDGLRELNKTNRCLASEVLNNIKRSLNAIVPNSIAEMIGSVQQGAFSWRALNANGENQTVSDWGYFSLQLAYSTKDSAKADINITLNNGNTVSIISRAFDCLGESASHNRFLVYLYYQKYKETGMLPLSVRDPCLSVRGANYTHANLFQNDCTLKLKDSKFLHDVMENSDRLINFIPFYNNESSQCSSVIEESLNNCRQIFQHFCNAEIGLSDTKIHTMRGAFSKLRKELDLSSSPSDNDWKQKLNDVCNSSPSNNLCFRGNFIHMLFKYNMLVFEDSVQWQNGYADFFFSKKRPKDSFTTISSTSFFVIMVLSTLFSAVGAFFTHEYRCFIDN